MKYFVFFLSFILMIELLNCQHSGQNSSYPGRPTKPYENSTMNHTHPYRPAYNFSNLANSSGMPYQQNPLPPFYNDPNSSIFQNFSEQQLTHYESNYFDSLAEILKNAFNHTKEEINEFTSNMSFQFNESFPENDFHSFFQDLLENMSNNSNQFAQELDSFNMYESNNGTNSSFKYEEFEYLNSLQAQMYEVRNKLFNLLSEQFVENIKDLNMSEPLPDDQEISTLFHNLENILKKQELHYDIQELYEELEDELQYLNSTERQNEIRQKAIRALNNSGTKLNQLREELESLLENQFYEEEQNMSYYQFTDEEIREEQKHQGNKVLIVIIIILLLIIVAAIGYYLFVRSKRRSEMIKFAPPQENAGFFRQIDEGVKV